MKFIWYYFVLTLVIELPLVLLCFKKQWQQALLAGFLLNLFTWPLLHILLYSSTININILELGVAIAEGTGYWLLMECGWKRGFAVGFAVNAVSYAAGLIINNYL